MFKEFTPIQWQAVEVANNFGHDKLTYEERIEWVKQNLDDLETMENPDEPELYNRAVRGLRLAQQGIPTGHTVALDAVCSGLQVMSVLMGCESGCSITGLIHQDVRSDAYTAITDNMNTMAPVNVSRKDAKNAVMTALYGSVKVPKDIFGEELLEVFYTALRNEAPGAVQLLELLRGAWNPDADYHNWELPDGHLAVVPVTEMVEKRVHVTELKYTPVILLEEVKPQEKGISLIAK